jgi:hypothetical protein
MYIQNMSIFSQYALFVLFWWWCQKLVSQIITFEHEGNCSKALEYYDLQVRSAASVQTGGGSRYLSLECTQPTDHLSEFKLEDEITQRKPYKGLIRSLQQIGCMHLLDLYCQGLTSRKGQFQHDQEFTELQVCHVSIFLPCCKGIITTVYHFCLCDLASYFDANFLIFLIFVCELFAVRGCLACRKLGFLLTLYES